MNWLNEQYYEEMRKHNEAMGAAYDEYISRCSCEGECECMTFDRFEDFTLREDMDKMLDFINEDQLENHG